MTYNQKEEKIMKTYYLTAKIDAATGHITVGVSDRSENSIMEIEAESFGAACKKISFHLPYCGKTAISGVGAKCGLYAEII